MINKDLGVTYNNLTAGVFCQDLPSPDMQTKALAIRNGCWRFCFVAIAAAFLSSCISIKTHEERLGQYQALTLDLHKRLERCQAER